MSIDSLSSSVKRFDGGSRVPGEYTATDMSKAPATVPDPALTPVPDDLRAAIEAKMALYPDPKSASIPALHLVQDRYGWCSPEAIEQAACVMRLTPAYLVSVASFYDMFRLTPQATHQVFVCTNITCGLLGGDRVCERLEALAAEDPDADMKVREFECLGACDMAPMASVDGVYVGPLDADSDPEAIVAALKSGAEVLPDKQLAKRKSVDPLLIGDEYVASPAGEAPTPDAGTEANS